MSNNPFLQQNGEQTQHQSNGAQSHSFDDSLAVQPPNGATVHASISTGTNGHHDTSLNSGLSTSTSPPADQSYSKNAESLPWTAQKLELQDQFPEHVTQSRHAHVPSFSHVRKESLPNARPTYIRALSSHISEVTTPQLGSGDAHAEVLRRLGKVDRVGKTIKRRGSNESLSSLISYSIRRPSVPVRPESGHSLDSLATVLEDAAQEGNLPLVEATLALGANPNFRSVHRLKNRRHDALNKATAAGHVHVIDFLLRQGATYNLSETQKKDPYTGMDYKLLDVAYSGFGEVAQYLVSKHGANPFIEQWPREYFDATRTVYRRVAPAKVYQRTVLDAIARIGNAEQDMDLLRTITSNPKFDPSAITTRVYEDKPYEGDGTRMTQTTYHYSALSSFIKAGWADAVGSMLEKNPGPSAYELPEKATSEEGQIPSANFHRYIYPANALIKDTWLYRPRDALRIIALLIKHNFNLISPQRTADDSAPRTLLSRAILANASEGVDMLLSAHPELVKEDIAFRLLLKEGSEQEYRAQPLPAAIVQGSLETAKVILRNGASPYDPAFSYPNVCLFAAGHGGSTATAMLQEMIAIAPDLLGEALETAIMKVKADAVGVLLRSDAAHNPGKMRLWDFVLACKDANKDDEMKRRYLQIIELVYAADTRTEIPRSSDAVVRKAIADGNDIGVDQLVNLGVIEDQNGS